MLTRTTLTKYNWTKTRF